MSDEKEIIDWSKKMNIRTEFEIRNANNGLIGNCTVYYRDGMFWVSDLWTGEELRGKGAGSAFLDKVIKLFGNHDLYLQIGAYADKPKDSDELMKLYNSKGFIETEVPQVLKRPREKRTVQEVIDFIDLK